VVYLLEVLPAWSKERIVPIRGAEALERLAAEIYRREMGQMIYTAAALFMRLAKIASGVSVRRLIRRPGLARLDEVASLLEADASAIATE